MDNDLQNKINDAILTQDSALAVEVLSALKKDPNQEIDHGKFLQLQFIRMNSLTPYKLTELLKESILEAYNIPYFDLGERIRIYIEQMDDVMGEIKLIRDIASILQSSGNVLGSKPVKLVGVENKPTIGMWIKDYLGIRTEDGIKNAFTQLQYMNTSESVRSLNEREKEVLKSLLKLNDYCADMIVLWESTPTPKSAKEAYEGFDLFQHIPGVDLNDETTSIVPNSNPMPQQIPVNNAIDEGSVRRPNDDLRPNPIPLHTAMKAPAAVRITKPAAKITDTDSFRVTPDPNLTISPNKPAPTVKVPESYVANPGDIHDLINKKSKPRLGVVMDPTNIKLDEERQRLNLERAAKEKMDKAAAIQQKLAELRSRKNSK